jgi:hypothetical protein
LSGPAATRVKRAAACQATTQRNDRKFSLNSHQIHSIIEPRERAGSVIKI